MLGAWRCGFRQLKSKWTFCFCHRNHCLVKFCLGFRAFSSPVCVCNTCSSLWWNKCSYVMLKDPVTHALFIHFSSTLSVGSWIQQCKIRSSHVRGYMIRHRWDHNTTHTAQRMWAGKLNEPCYARFNIKNVCIFYWRNVFMCFVWFPEQNQLFLYTTQRG